MDALIGGQNVELTTRLTLMRRPGNTAGLTNILSGANFPDIANTFYSFHELPGQIKVFVDGANSVYYWGANQITPIMTKSAGSGQTYFQGIGQSLYLADGVDQQKWLDYGIGNPGNSFTTVTATSASGGFATIISQNNFNVGQKVVISGTTNDSGAFNGTWTVTAANLNQFQFAFTGTVSSLSESGYASGTWNWTPAAPTVAPTINIVASGSAATTWTASTVYSTMGLLVDSNGNVQQIISVNAAGGNTTQLGTTGDGEPAWNQTPGGTTTDNTITWTNWGPVVPWTAETTYNNISIGGTIANPAAVWDSVTGAVFVNINPSHAQGKSGPSRPNFVAINEAIINDGTVKWECVYPAWIKWTSSTVYAAFPTTGSNLANLQNTAVVEPVALPAAGGTFPNNQTIYIQTSGGGTSAGSATAPQWATVAGQQTTDNQIIWLCLGSDTWAAQTAYTTWTGTSPVFSAIEDSNGNMQVCFASGTSGANEPLASWVANHTYSNGNTIVDTNGNLQTVTSGGTSGAAKTLADSVLTNGVATYTTTTNHGYSVGQLVTVTGSTHSAVFNINNYVITAIGSPTTFKVNLPHDNITTSSDAGSVYAGPTWATSAGTTTDGGVTWTFGGAGNGWGTRYGSQTNDGSVTWICVGPPMSWASATQWYLPASGFEPPNSSEPYGGAQIITNTGAEIQAVISSGLSTSSTPTFSTTTGNFTLDNTATWRAIGAYSQNSISWTQGYGYCYAYKARTVSDLYAPLPNGGGLNLGQPAGMVPSTSGGSTPTGSADGSVSTASPNAQMVVAPNSGSVVNLSGQGSTDPQVDTVSIFRTLDGGGTFFWLTDIKNPLPVGGVPQPWAYQDTIPDLPTATYPGTLEITVLAPLAHSNDSPLTGIINIVQHLGRIFYSVGSTVYCSEGPLVGGANQPPGNAYTAFNPSQYWTFPSPVTRLTPSTIGLLVHTTSDLGMVSGGSAITSQFPSILIPGLGLTWYNALANNSGVLYMLSADGQGLSLDPSLGLSEVGFPIGDVLAGFNPAAAYAAFHIQGTKDKAFFLADGSTGWYRCNPNQVPDYSISGPVWSPKATITGGVKAIASLEVAPGKHALVMGSASANQPLLVRDSTFTIFTDNNSSYDANFTLGSIVLAEPGQLAELAFSTWEFQKVGPSPKLFALLDEIYDPGGLFEDLSGFTFPATGLPPQDAPTIYGATGQSQTLYKPRFYFAQSIEGNTPEPTMCRHLQLMIDFGNNAAASEALTFTLYGRFLTES